MNEHEIFQKSFSALRASDHTLQEVMSRVHCGKGAKGISKRVVVLAAAMAMLFSMGVVVYGAKLLTEPEAVLTPAQDPAPVLDGAFGDRISTQKPNLKGGDGKPIEALNMERPPIDLAEADKLIGDYISDVDGVITVGEDTFTFRNFLIDETGCGAIRWTLENPNGVIYKDSGYGFIYFPSENPLSEPDLDHYGEDGTEKAGVFLFNALISKNEAGTKLELVSYFGTASEYQIGDSFSWGVYRDGSREAKRIHFTPEQHIPAKTMATAEGMRLRITNQSITFDDDPRDYLMNKIIIHFKDGTQYCLYDDENKIRNSSGSFSRATETYNHDGSSLLFNRLIDTNEVVSVEVTGNVYWSEGYGEDYKMLTRQESYVFYP